MSTKHVLDELSAYIDGEAVHPERIARHLQHCTDCARRHMALMRLSAHVQALPKPPENPDLLGRVLAEVGRAQAETEARPNVIPFAAYWKPLAGVAAAALLIVAVGLGWRGFRQEDGSAAPAAIVAENQPLLQDDAVITQMVALLDAGSDLALFEPVDTTEAAAEETLPDPPEAVDALLASIAATTPRETLELAEFDEDVFGDVEGLSGPEALAFQGLLATYLNEG